MNPQPLDANAVMWAVRQGQFPDTWQVYRARVSYLIQWPIIGLGFLLVAALVVIRTDVQASPLTRVVEIVVVMSLGLVGLWLLWYGATQFINLRDQALVVMPDGFVINTRKLEAFAFAAIEAINVRRGRYGYSVTMLLVGSPQRQSLPLDGRFGNVAQRVAQINAAHTNWRRAHGGAPSP